METNNGPRNPFAAMTTRELLFTAAGAIRGGVPGVASHCVTLLSSAPADVVDNEVEAALLTLVASLWTGGWQPAEVQRQGRLGCDNAAGARLISRAIAVDHAGPRAAQLHHL